MSGMGSDGMDLDDGESLFGNPHRQAGTKRHRSGFPGGFPSDAPPPPRQRPPPSASTSKPIEILRPLPLTLNELYSGAQKKFKTSRRLLSGQTEERTLDVNVVKGWKIGTKIRFPGAGNEDPGSGTSQDIVFVVEEKPHDTFTREGDDLIYNLHIPLSHALLGLPKKSTGLFGTSAASVPPPSTVTSLDGRKIVIPVPYPNPSSPSDKTTPLKPGQQIVISGEGMPISRKTAPKKIGDLIVKLQIDFPTEVDLAPMGGQAGLDKFRRVLEGR